MHLPCGKPTWPSSRISSSETWEVKRNGNSTRFNAAKQHRTHIFTRFYFRLPLFQLLFILFLRTFFHAVTFERNWIHAVALSFFFYIYYFSPYPTTPTLNIFYHHFALTLVSVTWSSYRSKFGQSFITNVCSEIGDISSPIIRGSMVSRRKEKFSRTKIILIAPIIKRIQSSRLENKSKPDVKRNS